MLYQVTLRQTYFNQAVINVFHYNSAGTPAAVAGSFALAYAFGVIQDGEPPIYPLNTVFDALRHLQNGSVTYDELEVAALYSDADFFIQPLIAGTTGLASSGDAASPVLSYGFYSNRVLRSVRRGFKRLAGVGEGWMGNGGVVAGDGISQTANVAAALGTVLPYDDLGNSLSFAPVVLSYEKYTTDSGKTAYRPYATLAEQLQHMATGILYTPYAEIRSQTSRQYGKGS